MLIMKKSFQCVAFCIAFLATTSIFAQKVNYIREDGSANNGKVEWTWTAEVDNAEVGVPKIILLPIKNISKEPISILSAKTHCGCTDAKAPEKPIGPGETANIEVTFTARPRYKKDANDADILTPPPFTFYQLIDVATSLDPKNPVLLSVQGTVIK